MTAHICYCCDCCAMAKLCFKSQLWEVRRSCSFTEIQIKLLTLFISWIFRVEVPRLSHHRIHHRKVAKDKEYFWVSQNHNNFNSAITYPLLSRYAAACIQQPLIDEVAGEPYHSACTNDTKSGRKQGWILETKLMLMKLCEVDIPPHSRPVHKVQLIPISRKKQDEAHEPECSHVC